MRQFSKSLCKICLLLLFPFPVVSTAAFNEKEPILCAIHDVHECGADSACGEVRAEDASLPDFMKILLEEKLISSVGPIDQGSSQIGRIERLENKLILQGGDASGDNSRGGVGWTLTVNEENGKLVMAGVGDGFALVVFGSCVQKGF